MFVTTDAEIQPLCSVFEIHSIFTMPSLEQMRNFDIITSWFFKLISQPDETPESKHYLKGPAYPKFVNCQVISKYHRTQLQLYESVS